MAQSVEQLICNLQVMGSSPFTSSKEKAKSPYGKLREGFFVLGQLSGTFLQGASSHVSATSKFAALLAAICARIGSRKAKSKAGFLPPFFVSLVAVWGMAESAYAGA